MTKRLCGNWLDSFISYAQSGEAPTHMYFWVGVSAIAGALRRKVWIDQAYFKWYPNFYIVLVAPPGIVSKSTTAGIAMNLLRKVPGIKFGPDVVTWQALVTTFAEAAETFEYNGEHHVMSPITLEASEFGNLLNPQDKEMVDLFVSLWDGKQGGFEKKTKHSGNDVVQNPWINLVACTTPSWIAGNFPEYMIGGGFTSRCVFVYADEKRQYVAYPSKAVPADMREHESRLVHDLEMISALAGQFHLTGDALEWGEAWYKQHYTNRPAGLDDDRFGGYIARKQTHIHKLAMILSAAEGDSLRINSDQLALANTMVSDLEDSMAMVFSKMGRTDVSNAAERLVQFVARRGICPWQEAYRYIHANIPSLKDFEDVLGGCIRAGYLLMGQYPGGTGMYLKYLAPVPSDPAAAQSDATILLPAQQSQPQTSQA